MCCLIYKFLLILTQKMQISFLKILPENALKFVSKKMRICVKNFAQLHLDKLKWDLMYIENYSLFLDLKILLMTAIAIFAKDNHEDFSKWDML